MKTLRKIWFNIGPYDGLIGYSTRKEAVANKQVNETVVGLELNRNQATLITNALNDAFQQLG